MKQLFQAFARLNRWQKFVVAAMLVLVLLTWLAVCLVLAIPAA
jgi:hypothetical protein